MQFDIGADEGSGELGIRGSTGAGTPDLGRNVMKLLTVLFSGKCQLLGFEEKVYHLIKTNRIDRTLSATIGPLVALVSAAIFVRR